MSDARLDALSRRARNLGRRCIGARSWPWLLFFTDPDRTPGAARTIARLPAGAGLVYRAFGATDALATGRVLRAIARRRRLVFMVGADAGLATALRADGLHLPERAAGRRGDISRWRRRFIVTAAAHGLAAVRRARAAGVEAVVVSPVFPSRSPSAGRPLGPLAFRTICRVGGLPTYALGGIGPDNARRLQGSGAVGLAGIEMFQT